MKVLRQIASLGMVEGIGRLCTFAFSSLVARYAGLETLGALSLALSLVAYATIAGDSGLNQDATRMLLAGESRRDVFRDSTRVQLSLSLFAFIIVVLLSAVIYGPRIAAFVGVLFPLPIATALSTPYLLDYVRRIGALAAARLVQTFSIGVCGVLLVVFGARGPALALSYGVGYTVGAAAVVVMSRAPYKALLQKIPKARLMGRLRAIRRLGSASVLLHVYASMPLALAGISSATALGELGVISRIWFLANAPAAMAGSVLVPVLSSSGSRVRVVKYCLLGGVLTSFIAALLSAFSYDILGVLFGEPARSASVAFSIFIWAMPAFAFVAVCSAYLIALHKEIVMVCGYLIAIYFFVLVHLLEFYSETIGTSIAWVVSSWVLALFVFACAVR